MDNGRSNMPTEGLANKESVLSLIEARDRFRSTDNTSFEAVMIKITGKSQPYASSTNFKEIISTATEDHLYETKKVAHFENLKIFFE